MTAADLIRCKEHARRLQSGELTHIRATWVVSVRETKSFHHRCRDCNAPIVTVRMRSGGWVHFESAAGLTRLKHPYLHKGEGLSRRRDQNTLDLFEDYLGE